MEQKKNEKPVHEVKLPFNGGILIGAIWRQQDDQGQQPRFSASFSRGYKDETTGKWAYSTTFTRDQLLGLIRVVEVTHGYIVSGGISGGDAHE